MPDVVLFYVTCATPIEAEKIGTQIIEEGLAACANIIPGMTSIYKWQGQLEKASETILVLKGVAHLEAKVYARVKSLHSYTTPCILTLPILNGDHEYVRWLTGSIG